MAKKIKSVHGFRVGDIVRHKVGKKDLYVICGTDRWVHGTWRNEDGSIDSWISLAKAIGEVSLLDHASEYKLVKRREMVGKKWWTIFPEGEKN